MLKAFSVRLAEPLEVCRKTICVAWEAICLICALSACSSLPQAERNESHAILNSAHTRLGKAIAPRLGAHIGMSGAYPLAESTDAFGARIGLARVAQQTLDLQYYIFNSDNTGLVLLGELLSAADRGVRVRLLLDDFHTGDLERVLATIAVHPNVEVRLFNPFIHRRARWLDAVTDFGRINRRMHNKSLIADNAAAIVGGRNIGDEYFGAKPDVDFSDLDMLMIGPVVTDVSAQFDAYWNSQVAYPVASLLDGPPPAADSLRELRVKIAEQAQTMQDSIDALDPETNELASAIATGQLPVFFWGSATVIADPPVKVMLPPQDSSEHAATQLVGILDQAKHELLLVSPYFVPGNQGVQWLHGIAKRGVRVQVITNSFAATDVRAVHAGYSRYREALLQAGIELYEMKPSARTMLARESRRRSLSGSSGSSRSSLHAKTYMVGQREVYVGSFNLDPRSARLNTEMGVVFESEPLCAKLRDSFVREILDIAYRVELAAGPQSGGPHLIWVTRENHREVRYDSEPGVGLLQKLFLELLRILPIEDQL
jgi:putative cardiolipin synthase